MPQTKTKAVALTDSRRFVAFGLLTIAILLLAGCGAGKDAILFDGQSYRAKLSREDRKTRTDFTINVSPVSASFEGALEAGRYEGTRYCVETFGTSEIAWVVGPDDDRESFQIVKDSLLLSGACRF